MAKPDLLTQLRDIHLPADVSWWPLALGWWILIALILISTIYFIVRYKRSRLRNRYSCLALKELDKLHNKPDTNWLIELNVLLKRSSLSHFKKSEVASLTEQQWIDFLLATSHSNNGNSIWSDDSLRLLRDGVFRQSNSISSEQRELLFQQSKLWITQLPAESSSEFNYV